MYLSANDDVTGNGAVNPVTANPTLPVPDVNVPTSQVVTSADVPPGAPISITPAPVASAAPLLPPFDWKWLAIGAGLTWLLKK